MSERQPRIVWVILVALALLAGAVLTSTLASAQETTEGQEATTDEATPAEGDTTTGDEATAQGEAAAEGEAATQGDAETQGEAAGGEGQAVYTEKCARCHGEDGHADTRMGQRFEARAFSPEMLAELGADGVRTAIVEGRENMRATTDLTDEQLDALVQYVFSLGGATPE